MKETKNLITHDGCRKNLISSAKADLRFNTVIMCIFLFIELLFVLLGMALWEVSFILTLLIPLPLIIPAIVYIYYVIKSVKRLRFVETVGISIVKDTVSHLSKNERERKSFVDVIYFTNYGRCISSGTEFDLASVGDEFILVVLHTKDKEIAYSYHTMMYECKELDSDK